MFFCFVKLTAKHDAGTINSVINGHKLTMYQSGRVVCTPPAMSVIIGSDFMVPLASCWTKHELSAESWP